MKLYIPGAGICEVSEIKDDYYTDVGTDIHDDFTVVTKNDTDFILCHPDSSTALCKFLFGRNPMVECFLDYAHPDIDFWFFTRNEFSAWSADDLSFSGLFYLWIALGFIKKIAPPGLEEITGNRDFIYVYSDSYVSQKSPALWQLAFEILEKSSLEYLDMKIDSFECENPDLSKTDYESGIEKIRAEHKRFIAELENARDALVYGKT